MTFAHANMVLLSTTVRTLFMCVTTRTLFMCVTTLLLSVLTLRSITPNLIDI